MRDLFKAAVLRLLLHACVAAALHLAVFGFMSRAVDLAQQPQLVYRMFGAVYAAAGLLLGVYQMGGYRRPSTWLLLLHRPVAHWRVAVALLGAGATLLFVAVLLPLLVIAAWQETMTARVLDLRHWLLALSGFLIALCGYLVGCYLMLANRRYSFSALIFLALLVCSEATGAGAIVVQVLAMAWLSGVTVIAFKPDLRAAPQGLLDSFLVAVPLQIALWSGLLLSMTAIELVSTIQPTNRVSESVEAIESATGREMIVSGLTLASAPDAALWREQAALSEVFTLEPRFDAMPTRDELTNQAPMEFDDEERRDRWVFSHDSMLFEGYSLLDRHAVGQLGVEGEARFREPPLPGPLNSLISRGAVYQYDAESRRVSLRVRLADDETVVDLGMTGENVSLLSSRALYLYDSREWQDGGDALVARKRISLPGRPGGLSRVDLMELLDGHLISFAYTRHASSGGSAPFQQLMQVTADGDVTVIAHRDLRIEHAAWRYRNWHMSPLLHAASYRAVASLGGYTLARDTDAAPVQKVTLLIAGALMALSLLAAIWWTRETSLSTRARIVWIVVCGLVGISALLSLWLLQSRREVVNNRAVSRPASAGGKWAIS